MRQVTKRERARDWKVKPPNNDVIIFYLFGISDRTKLENGNCLEKEKRVTNKKSSILSEFFFFYFSSSTLFEIEYIKWLFHAGRTGRKGAVKCSHRDKLTGSPRLLPLYISTYKLKHASLTLFDSFPSKIASVGARLGHDKPIKAP